MGWKPYEQNLYIYLKKSDQKGAKICELVGPKEIVVSFVKLVT